MMRLGTERTAVTNGTTKENSRSSGEKERYGNTVAERITHTYTRTQRRQM
jgi:hypothetical protein